MFEWSEMAAFTLGVLGEPCAFFIGGEKVHETSGVFRNAQESRRMKNKKLSVMDCETLTIPYTNKVKKGQKVALSIGEFSVNGDPLRDGSGGLIIKLSTFVDGGSGGSDPFDR